MYTSQGYMTPEDYRETLRDMDMLPEPQERCDNCGKVREDLDENGFCPSECEGR